jgi:predicted O-methyltransferase YrrM
LANKKLYFALLNKGWVRREFAAQQLTDMRNTEGVEFVWENPVLTWGHPICSNRNAIVQRFLKTDCEFLMMQDDDIIPLHNPAELVYADKDVVGCPAKVRQDGHQLNWVAFVRDVTGKNYVPVDMSLCPSDADLIPVDVVGTGLICIKRKVIEAIKAPFMDTFDENGIRELGTDFAFCERAKEKGFEIYTTPYRVCEHVKELGLLDIDGYDDSDKVCTDNFKYKIAWGGMAILQKDIRFIREKIKQYDVKTVVEFGLGLSSLLMSEDVPVVSYETDEAFAKDILTRKTDDNKLAVAMWDGVSEPLLEQRGPFDMAFIDGPHGSKQGREFSIKAVAKAKVPLVIVHDAGRRGEVLWQNRYLRKDYDLIDRNGNHSQRCQLWQLKH